MGCSRSGWDLASCGFDCESSKALAYETTSGALCLGPLRVPLPRWFRPHVRALERPTGDCNQVDVFVEVSLPLLGRLIAYEGKLTCAEAKG